VYPTENSQRFYTDECGKSQTLDKGNILITEAKAGRVFEVDPSTGETVWEWIHEPYSKDPSLVAEVLQGTRYNTSYLSGIAQVAYQLERECILRV
jgi:outer membrane protein assembly factor BamB